MIALDSSVVIAFVESAPFPERDYVRALIADGAGILPPATITELLSDAKGGQHARRIVNEMKVLPILDGYWERAGLLRAKVRRAGRKAALGDALIAQSCIDSDVALLTRDTDFRAFADLAGLKLARKNHR